METDEQTLEEIKKWWKEHGRTVIAGVVLGLGTVIGWTTWKSHQEAKAEELSLRYQALVDTAAQENRTDAMLLADAIIADQPESSYAALSALVAAHSAFKNKDLNRARDYLQWAVDNATAFKVSDVARVRLARVLSAQGDHDAALQQLDQVTDAAFTVLTAEARGDVLGAKQDREGARAAYEGALASEDIDAGARERIRLKIDVLARG